MAFSSSDEPFIADLLRSNTASCKVDKDTILKKIGEIFGREDPRYLRQDSSICCVPFVNYYTGEETYIPLRAIDIMCGSNGLCAGNTKEEALVQGLSELCERYVNRRIIEDKITPPDIPRSYIKANYPQLERIIYTLEGHGLGITIKDCSLGERYPVVAVICRDVVTEKYFIKFGASPDLGIAIERCLTETFQGRSLKSRRWLKKRFYVEDAKFIKRNIETNLHNGNGYYPLSFFGASKSAFKGWFYSGNSNEKYLDEMTKVLTENGFDIYIRDWSATSFPTYQIYIPGISFIYSDVQERLEWHIKLSAVRKSFLHMSSINLDELEVIRSFMAANSDSNSSIAPFLPVPMFGHNRFSTLSIELFVAAIYIKNNMFAESFNALYPLYRSSDDVLINMLAIWLILKSSGKDEGHIQEYLQASFSSIHNEEFREFLHDGDILANYELKCFNCSACKETSCCFRSVGNIYNKVRSFLAEKKSI